MQFDVVIGNPPYQMPKNIEGKKKGTIGGDLWSKFVELSINLCKDNGHIALIHPPMWRKPEHKLWNLLTRYQIKYLNIYSKKDGIKTFGAATRYDWYILQKVPYSSSTIVLDESSNKHKIDFSQLSFLPNYNYKDFWKCIAKAGEDKCEVMYSRSAYGTDKKHISKEQTEEHKWPCIHGLRKGNDVAYWYSNTNQMGHFGIPKVILTWGEFQYPLVDFEGKYGMTQIVFGIKISSKEEGDDIKKAIESDRFKKIIDCSKWSPFQTEWRMFKYFKKDFYKDFLDDTTTLQQDKPTGSTGKPRQDSNSLSQSSGHSRRGVHSKPSCPRHTPKTTETILV